MKKILIIEDDEVLGFGLCEGVKSAGYEIMLSESIGKAKLIIDKSVDLILLDLNLPDGSGYDYCTWVKSRQDTPIIILTVRGDEADIIKGLNMGADDYITKPFSLPVLLSRISAVLRRTAPDTGNLLQCGNITLDTSSTRVTADGYEVTLGASEYRLLEAMISNKGQVLTRGRLLEKLWDTDGSFVNDNTLTVTMKRLREKLGGGGCIKTLRGIGYRMEDEL